MFLLKFLLLIFLFIYYNPPLTSANIRCIESEREALLIFKDTLTDEGRALSSWGTEPDCCDWKGVLCRNSTTRLNTSHVVALLLQNSSLGGEITSELLHLHHLTRLDLSYNHFKGSEIPSFIGSMKQLQHLNLSMASFAGAIPPQIGNLTGLRTLDLSNYLQKNDTWHHNKLNGRIPDIFMRMRFLEYLDLSGNNLEGEIPKSLGNLSRLNVLYLHHNHLQGPIDHVFGHHSIMSSLENLDFGYNQISGPLPDLTAFPAIKKLYFADNKLSGPVPTSLGQLSNLEVLDFCFNSLEGMITESEHFVNLGKLKVLDLSFNLLVLNISSDWDPPFQLDIINLGRCNVGPTFPKWIRNQSDLSWLDFSLGGISDEVPNWLWSLFPPLPGKMNISLNQSYKYLNLSHNQINGTIPDLSSYHIDIFDVSYNNISGNIPLFQPYTYIFQLGQNTFSGSITSICSIPHNSLAILDLSNNYLNGELPNCWEKMGNLKALNLENNSFSGQIPHSLGSLLSLVALHLRDNNLSGELPLSLRNCQSLILIDVGGNRLTGNIPPWIGASYDYLINLNLRSNSFYGSIPSQICSLTGIQVLDVSRNNLSGNIPECFSNFTSLVEKTSENATGMLHISIKIPYDVQSSDAIVVMEDIEYSLVQWKGRESEYRKNLALLKLIDLSSNILVGSIPQSFSSMRELISLNLSRNGLTGNIIPDIGRMEMLECLDLSKNQLSGEIPNGLAQLHYLDVLDLSNNRLSGEIPSSTQLQSFNASVYAANNGLCGRPLALCPKDGPSMPTENEGEDTKEEDDGFFGLSLMQEFSISMTFGFIVGFWGVVGSLMLNKSWRCAYFSFVDSVGERILRFR